MSKVKTTIWIVFLVIQLSQVSSAEVLGQTCHTQGISVDEIADVSPISLRAMKKDGASAVFLIEKFDELVWRLILNYKMPDSDDTPIDRVLLYEPNDDEHYVIKGAEYRRYLSHLLLGNLAFELELNTRAKQNLLEAVETWMGYTRHGVHFEDNEWWVEAPTPYCGKAYWFQVLGFPFPHDLEQYERQILEIRVNQLIELADKLEMTELSEALYREYMVTEVLPTQVVKYKNSSELAEMSLKELMELASENFAVLD